MFSINHFGKREFYEMLRSSGLRIGYRSWIYSFEEVLEYKDQKLLNFKRRKILFPKEIEIYYKEIGIPVNNRI